MTGVVDQKSLFAAKQNETKTKQNETKTKQRSYIAHFARAVEQDCNRSAMTDHWIPDDAVDQCMKCKVTFTLTNRRHHCRACGGIFCAKCSASRSRLEGWDEPQRVCDGCIQKKTDFEQKSSRVKAFEQKHALFLQKGVVFLKHGRKGLPHRRLITLNETFDTLSWRDPEQEDEDGRDFSLADCEVVDGRSTNVLKKALRAEDAKCFSIVGPVRTLDLETESVEMKQRYIDAIKEAIWIATERNRCEMMKKQEEERAQKRREDEQREIQDEARRRVEERQRMRRANQQPGSEPKSPGRK